MTYGKASLHNIPWTRGGCFKEKCDCVFNEEQLGRYSLPKCPGTTKTWLPLEHQVNLAEAEYQYQMDKTGARAQFDVFKQTWGKTYKTKAEEEKRFIIFQESLETIKQLNEEREKRKDTAVFGVTIFADLTEEEFKRMYMGPAPGTHKLKRSASQVQRFEQVKKAFGIPTSPPRNVSESPSKKTSKSPSRKTSKSLLRRRSRSPERSQNLQTRMMKNPFRTGSKNRSQSNSPPRKSKGRSGKRSPARGASSLSDGEESCGSLGQSASGRRGPYRMDDDEGNGRRRRRRRPQSPPPPPPIVGPDPRGTPEVDWRVPASLYPPVGNQKIGDRECGCCWSFACIGAMEIIWAHQENEVVRFSVQDLIDCQLDNQGCNGGFVNIGLDWMMGEGVCLEEVYPFTADGDSKCEFQLPRYARISGYETLNPYQSWAHDFIIERALKDGPLPAGYPQSPSILRYYVRGVFAPSIMYHDQPTGHAVVLVGHYTRPPTDSWIIRNSWGPEWGMEGHFLVKKGTMGIGYDIHKITGPIIQIWHSEEGSESPETPPYGGAGSSSYQPGGYYPDYPNIGGLSIHDSNYYHYQSSKPTK
nr:PREDICTED: uncharacterized protein LOC109030028 [Bemisia tabaci]